MKVTVKCFSQVKYALKVNQILLDLEPGQTTADVEEAVRKHAAGKLDGISLRIAVNRVYVQEPVVVEDGDEVALIPPVQGG
jgi:molybdopterin converting factor small subunit